MLQNKVAKKLYDSKPTIFGFGVILLMCFLAIFGHLIAPDNSDNANCQNLNLRLKPLGYKFIVLKERKSSKCDYEIISFFKEKSGKFEYKKVNENTVNTISKEEFSQDYEVQDKIHILGTDVLGRDILSRLIIGARTSMSVGIGAVLISLIIGVFLGVISGYYGGKVDLLVMWLINVFWAIPTILIAMALIMGISGNGLDQFWYIFVAIGLTMWVETARIVRGQFLQLKEREFVTAAKALGYSDFTIILKHILPNTIPIIIVVMALNFAAAILIESGLSFLGLGVQPPTPSWGGMLREYYSYLGTGRSLLPFLPGFCIMITVFSFYTIGNGLRDALDVKL